MYVYIYNIYIYTPRNSKTEKFPGFSHRTRVCIAKPGLQFLHVSTHLADAFFADGAQWDVDYERVPGLKWMYEAWKSIQKGLTPL